MTRDALRNHERRDLVLDLRYAPGARDRVRKMVRNEQACCSFLTLDLREKPDEIRLIITAPEAAREAADMLFEQFAGGVPAPSACASGAPSASSATTCGAGRQLGTKAAGLTAMTLSTGAVAWLAAPWEAALVVAAGLLSLVFAYLLTLVETNAAGRAYAAYGGIYIVASLFWLWGRFESVRPDWWDIAGAVICLIGAAVILTGPRG